MLKIIVDKQEVDLGNLKSITIKYNSGIFDFNTITGSYSIPFTLPLNEINSVIFGFPYRIENNYREKRTYDCEIWHSGILMLEGTITASLFNNKSISCNFEVSSGNLYKKLNEKKLNEHNYGGAKPFVIKQEYSIDTDDYVLFAVENENFCDGTEWENFYKYGTVLYNPNAEQNHFNTVTNDFTFIDVNAAIITPFPLLWRVLKYLFTNLGFNFSDTFFSSGDYRRLNIFNVNNAIVAEYIDNSGKLEAHNRIYEVDIANHLPEMSTSDFIKGIQNMFNVFFLTNNKSIKVIDRLEMIKSNTFSDISDKVTGDYIKKIIEVKTNGIYFNSVIDENDLNIIQLPHLKDYKTPRHIIGEMLGQVGEANEVVYSEDYGHYYRFRNQAESDPENIPESWYFIVFPLMAAQYPDQYSYVRQMPWRLDGEEIKLDLLPTPLPESIFNRNHYDSEYWIPKAKQKGNSFVNKGKKNKFSFRLLYYIGMQETFESEYDNRLNRITQPVARDHFNDKEISAKWSYEYRWKEFLEWYSKAAQVEYEQNIKFSASEIKNFDFAEKKKINGKLFFIKNLSVQLTRKEIKPAKCTLIDA